MVRPPDDPDTVRTAFAPHAYVIVAPPTHPLAGRRRISRKRVLQEPFIVREPGSDTYRSMQDAFGRDAPCINAAMEIRSNETIKQAVIAGTGVSFLSSHAIALDVRAGNLVVLDVVGFRRGDTGTSCIAQRNGCPRSPLPFANSCSRTARLIADAGSLDAITGAATH